MTYAQSKKTQNSSVGASSLRQLLFHSGSKAVMAATQKTVIDIKHDSNCRPCGTSNVHTLPSPHPQHMQSPYRVAWKGSWDHKGNGCCPGTHLPAHLCDIRLTGGSPVFFPWAPSQRIDLNSAQTEFSSLQNIAALSTLLCWQSHLYFSSKYSMATQRGN